MMRSKGSLLESNQEHCDHITYLLKHLTFWTYINFPALIVYR